jgi:hypothetical protein
MEIQMQKTSKTFYHGRHQVPVQVEEVVFDNLFQRQSSATGDRKASVSYEKPDATRASSIWNANVQAIYGHLNRLDDAAGLVRSQDALSGTARRTLLNADLLDVRGHFERIQKINLSIEGQKIEAKRKKLYALPALESESDAGIDREIRARVDAMTPAASAKFILQMSNGEHERALHALARDPMGRDSVRRDDPEATASDVARVLWIERAAKANQALANEIQADEASHEWAVTAIAAAERVLVEAEHRQEIPAGVAQASVYPRGPNQENIVFAQPQAARS